MTDIKLNTFTLWTEEDRYDGECPMPAGSEVTIWFNNGTVKKTGSPEEYLWRNHNALDYSIVAYVVHSVPHKPIVRWMLIGHPILDGTTYETRKKAERAIASVKGIHYSIVKVKEVDDD